MVTLVAALTLSALTVSAGASSSSATALPRAATLYTSGTAWGPFTNFNPLRSGYATGVLGLLYETLFRYDPLKDKFIPWLATNGRWAGKTYVADGPPRHHVERRQAAHRRGREVHVRDRKARGLGALDALEDGPPVRHNGRQHVVRFTFKGTPNYQEWDFRLYYVPIVPRHVWSGYTPTQITTGNADETSKMVGTGPFKYGAGKGSSQTLQWNRRAGWWATKALGMRMPMKYIVDIHNTQNTASLQNFLQDKIDLSNNFFPGVDKVIGGKVATYYKKAPYMLAANTAWLVPNTTKKPLNDKAFRRALATSINIDQIVKDDYGNIVSKANPTGLLPTWSKWIDKAQVKRLGFTYSIARAKQMLAAAGYRDTNGDGFVENKDGSSDQPADHRPERLVGLDDRDPDDRRQHEGCRDPGHPGLSGLQRARRRAELRQVRPRHQQREVRSATRRTPTTTTCSTCRSRTSQTFANFSRFTEAGAKPWALTLKLNKTKATNVQGRGEDPLADPEGDPRGSACDPALVQRHVVAVQHQHLDELPRCGHEAAVHAQRSGTATST